MNTRLRRTAATLAAGLLVAALVDVTLPASSQADDDHTLTVVGTSDVFDSNLWTAVLKPGFEASHPGVTANYLSKGTTAAIALAKTGVASALIVHAASAEKDYVGGGFSLDGYGPAIFWGDYVLLGPTSDPSNIAATYPHDIAGAFKQIATDGPSGKARFITRNDLSGTNIQEHKIWGLTTGVPTCTEGSTGGTQPSNTVGACPTSPDSPSWYAVGSTTQAANVQAADACTVPGGNNNCYVFTDRGTYEYLKSTGAIPDLKVVTRDNDATAPGGNLLLVNSFHAYAINPAMTSNGSQVSMTLGREFLAYITSPAAQQAIGQYLAATGKPVFIPDAAPGITTSALPTGVRRGQSVTISGRMANVVPGTPALDGVPLTLLAVPQATPSAAPVAVGSVVTDAAGQFTMTYPVTQSVRLSLSSPAITKIEDATLTPAFGDRLAATTVDLGIVGSLGKITVGRSSHRGHSLRVSGKVTPKLSDRLGVISLLAGHPGQPLTLHGAHRLKKGTKKYSTKFHLPKGTWKYQVVYSDGGLVASTSSAVHKVKIR